MAIKKIDDIYIDGRNRAFGGYIYSVNYDANFGEQPSTLVVEVVNESGVYDISKNDLTTSGSANAIKIGTKIVLYMYPVAYNIQKSPGGKFLRVEYIDESVVYLDKQIVKLKTRGKTDPLYENTIVLGTESINSEPTSKSVADQVFPENAEEELNSLQVTDVEYTFPDLLEKIDYFTGTAPTLDAAAKEYRRDYCGRLREVISAWCNDLGLGFYWENRKLNFIDLRNPATLKSVETYANKIKKENNIEESTEGYSIRDTFSRGCEVFFGKDGCILDNTTNADGQAVNYVFNNIQLRYSLIQNFVYSSFTDPKFIKEYSAAYYGTNFYALHCAMNNLNSGWISEMYRFSNVTDRADIIPNVVINTKLQSSWQNYNWYAAISNPKKSFEVIAAKIRAYAKFYGRFYTFSMSTQERAVKIFGANTSFYNEKTLLKDVDVLMNVLSPLSDNIKNFDTLTLRGFINGNPNDLVTNFSPTPITGSDLSGAGYVIKEIEPLWNPMNSDPLIAFENTVIIEGSDSATDTSNPFITRQFDILTTEGTETYPVFYFGILKTATGTLNNFQRPLTSPITETVQSFPRVNFTLGGCADKIEYTQYDAPKTKNVNYYDLHCATLNEEQVLGANAYYYEDLEATRNAFDKAATDLVKSTLFDQSDPFFSLSITIPNIDLGGPSLSLGKGLQSFSVSIGDNGVTSSYTFGNEKMRLRNPDVFYRYTYDSALKKQGYNQVWSETLRTGRSSRRFF